MTIAVVVFVVANLGAKVVLWLGANTFAISFGFATFAFVCVEVVAGAPFVVYAVAVVVKLVVAHLVGVILAGFLAHTAAVRFGCGANSCVAVFVQAGAVLFQLAVAVVVDVVSTNLNVAVEGRALA